MNVSVDDLASKLRATMASVSAIIARSDQRRWSTLIDALRAQVDRNPGETARKVLALFEGAPAYGKIVIAGDYALDTIVLTHDGVAFASPGPRRDEAFAYARLRYEMYQDALALWQQTDWARLSVAGESGSKVKLADYGFGAQIWFHEDRYIVRYNCGGHIDLWRQDEITAREAEQGMLGGKHFDVMIMALQNRLKAAGVDSYVGSAAPLADP